MYSDEDYQNENVEESNNHNESFLSSFYNANKKLIWILGGVIIVFLLIMMFTGGGGNNNPVETTPNLIITTPKQNVSINNSVKLIAYVENNLTAPLIWTSSDPNVASVDTTGLVRGIKFGTAIITATYTHTDGKPYTVSCEVTVSEGNPNVQIYSVNFQEGEVIISVGDEFTLPVIISPSDGYVTGISYNVSNPSVVSVDDSGKIRGLSVGKTVVRLSVNNNQFTDEIVVNVVQEKVLPQVVINPTSILFNEDKLELEIGKNSQLVYTVLPANASVANLVWESSDPTVVTVSNGIITTLKKGVAVITVKTLTGLSDTITIDVIEPNIPVESISVSSGTYITLNKGETHQIIPMITPSDATNTKVTYTSDKSSIAWVDDNGLVTANIDGTATITLTTEDGNKTAMVTVVVGTSSTGGSSTVKVKEIKPFASSITVVKGNRYSIAPTIEPSNATNKNVDCISSNQATVSVASFGTSCQGTGLKVGTATITIKAKDGSGKTATVKVTVKENNTNCTNWGAWSSGTKQVVTNCTPSNSKDCTNCNTYTTCTQETRYRYNAVFECEYERNIFSRYPKYSSSVAGDGYTTSKDAKDVCESKRVAKKGTCPSSDNGVPFNGVIGSCSVSSYKVNVKTTYTRTCA